jgi:hypothetical protein
VRSPDPSTSNNILFGVTAVNAHDVWAVGTYSDGTADQTLVLRFNGHAWEHVASPDPAGPARSTLLFAVAVAGPQDAWAVGQFSNGVNPQAMALHCC